MSARYHIARSMLSSASVRSHSTASSFLSGVPVKAIYVGEWRPKGWKE